MGSSICPLIFISCRSRVFLSQIILATSCALRYKKPQQSRLHRKCCSVCTQSSLLAGPACLFVCELYYSTFMPDCLLICPQTNTAPCLPSRLQLRKKKKVGFCVTLNLKDKVRRGGWHNRRKGPSSSLCHPRLFFFLYLQGWQALVPVPTCVYCFGDQTGHCLKRVSECEGAENGFKKCAER